MSARSFDVVLLDLSLPDSSELESLAKSQSNTQHVAIVVLTGLNDEDLAVEAVRKGGQDYPVKGQIDENLLPRAIRYAIERNRMEEALRESEEKYRLHFENVSDVVYSVDSSFEVLSVSPSVERILGYKPEELIGRPFQDLNILALDYLEEAISETMRVLAGERIDSKV